MKRISVLKSLQPMGKLKWSGRNKYNNSVINNACLMLLVVKSFREKKQEGGSK